MSDFEIAGDDHKVVPPPLPENHGKPLSPVMAVDRMFSMDVVRGLALLGILISNMLFFSQPLSVNGLRDDLWFSPMDKFADWISIFLIEGKFYPLFSIIFGMGVSIQMDRASSRGLDFKAVYLRRLYVLMGFGLLHGILLWEGDVLLAYALCGLVLLLFRNRKAKTLLFWAVGLILGPASLILLLGVLLFVLSGNPFMESAMKEVYEGDQEIMNEMYRAFVTGSYKDVLHYRIGEMIFTYLITLFYAPAYLGLFLIGMFAGRKGILADVQKHKRLLVRTLLICGATGLATNFLAACLVMSGLVKPDYGLMLIGIGIISIFGPLLTCAYISSMALLIHRYSSWGALFSPFASVGRMALTNYLAQSLIATTIFYGYGFGLGGNIGRMGTIGISLSIFTAQIVFSVCWLKFYRYGPMEWLWRSLTYGLLQPMALRKQTK